MQNIKLTLEKTSNPAIIKFNSNESLASGKFECKNIEEAKNFPVAQQLFYLPFVKTVFISEYFIAVERFNILEWDEVQEEVQKQLEDYLNNGGLVQNENVEVKKVPVTVYAESTPNPGVMKFVANKPLVENGVEFKNIDDAKEAPLAQNLFHFPFVKEVFMDKNFVSITKFDIATWEDITMEVREFIRSYIEDGKPIIDKSSKLLNTVSQTESITEKLDEISSEIVAILDEYVKPAVASDGGNIIFKSYDTEKKSVHVILQGACSGCPSSTFTLKNGIENMLKEMLPGKVATVEAING